jgi:WD repeat-containing protein 35
MEDFEQLDKMVQALPENSPLLDKLGDRLMSMGICETAVEAYKKKGEIKKAIDCCVLLNHWNQAVELAEQHNFL